MTNAQIIHDADEKITEILDARAERLMQFATDPRIDALYPEAQALVMFLLASAVAIKNDLPR